MNAVYIKLGGSLITDKTKPYTFQARVVAAVAQELADCWRAQKKPTAWFIGNGAGSFGHYAVHEAAWKDNPRDPARIAHVRRATSELNLLVLNALRQAGLPVITLPAAAFVQRRQGAYHGSAATLRDYASQGLIPLVYGDVIHDDVDGSAIMSTETILQYLADDWRAHAGHNATVVYATSVDGVYDQAGNVLPRIGQHEYVHFGETNGFDVSGGMAQKVAAGLQAAEHTDYVAIINGATAGSLQRAVAHKPVGTRLEHTQTGKV